MTFEETAALVEKSLEGLKLDLAKTRGEKAGQWSFTVKDATVWIDVFNFPTAPERFYFQVMSPLCAVPDKRADEFYQNLLEINHSMYGSWMCKKGEWLYVLSLREAAGLGQSEVDATIDRVAHYSSDYYAKLAFKYEGCWLPKNTPGSTVPGAPH
ncbi:MAG: YbjN domain-containing protein [Chitinophagales bacterium]